MLITVCNSSFSSTDSACALSSKKYEVLMHVLANAHIKAILIIFLCFSKIAYTILYRGHNNTTSIINLWSCLHEKALSP